MNRRGFLGAILATACAPAIVRADALMRIVPREAVALGDLSWPPRAGGYLVPPEMSPLLTGEIGRYEGITFHEEPKWRSLGCLVTWDNHPLNPIFRL